MKYVMAVLMALGLFLLPGCDLGARLQQRAQTESLERFYQLVMATDVDGLPSKEVMEQLKPLISSRLRDALLKAQDAEDRHKLETQGTVPPLFEGPVFLGAWEGAQRIIKMTPESVNGQVSYLVTFLVRHAQGKEPTDFWTDRVILVEEKGHWVVQDLVLQANAASTDLPTLSYNLQHADRCYEPSTQADMDMCAANAYDMAQSLLNETYKQLLLKQDKSRQASLTQAQLAWVKFKDLQCAHEASVSQGGSIQPLVRSTCLTDLMQQRRQQLQALMQEAH